MTVGQKTRETKTPRALLWLLIGLAAVLTAAALGLGALTGDRPAPGASAGGVGGAFRLEAGDGRVVTEADLRGAPFLVFFGYTHCPDVCPTTLFKLSEAFRLLGPEAKIKALFVTVDPERDTPALMQEFASNFDPRILGLSGDRAAIDAMLRAYRVYAKKIPGAKGDYTMDHSAVIYLMDSQGRFLRAFNLERPPEQAAAELKPLL